MSSGAAPGGRRSLVWKRPGPAGQFEVLRGLGGIVAPVLAGFSLAAIVTLVTTDSGLPLAGPAVAAFSWSTVFLLFSMQFAFLALRHAALPSDRLSWHPEAKVDDEAREKERLAQARDHALALYYERLTRHLYNLGLLFFLVSLGLLLVPRDVSVWHVIALTGVAVGVLVELNWIVARGPLYRVLIREAIPFREPTELDAVSKEALRES